MSDQVQPTIGRCPECERALVARGELELPAEILELAPATAVRCVTCGAEFTVRELRETRASQRSPALRGAIVNLADRRRSKQAGEELIAQAREAAARKMPEELRHRAEVRRRLEDAFDKGADRTFAVACADGLRLAVIALVGLEELGARGMSAPQIEAVRGVQTHARAALESIAMRDARLADLVAIVRRELCS